MTAVASTPLRAQALPAHRAGLVQAVRAEWSSFWSVRSTMWSLIVTAVLVLGISVLSTATRGAHDPIEDFTRISLIGILFAQLSLGVLAVLVMSTEYSTGSIRSTLAVMPRRPVVLVAKVLVFGTVAYVVTQVLAVVAFLVGQAFLARNGAHATLSDPGVVRALVGSAVYVLLLALMALGIATIVRHTAAAITVYVGVLLIVPLLVQAFPLGFVNAVSRYLPLNIGTVAISVRTPQRLNGTPLFGHWMGLAVLAAYALVALVAGGVLMARRDS